MSKSAKAWFTTKAAGKGVGDIRLFNDIGDFGITAMEFAQELDALGDVSTLNIAISSNGGDIAHGFAIFNILNNHKARKVVRIEGLAASMASVIAMVGDEVVMPSNAMMMIHNPWGALMGEADQIKSFGEALATMQDNIADAYVARTGMDKAEVLDMMARETWLSAKKAVELGFADSVENALQMAAAFDLSKFGNVPRKFADANKRIATMAKQPKNALPPESDEEDAEGNTSKTAAQMRADILAHNREVRSICNLSGFPKMADKFIEDDLSISQVIAALDKAKADAAKGGNAKGGDRGRGRAADDEIDAHNAGRGDNHKPAAEINPREIYSRWNKSGTGK
jgi:ATP-dependent Clp protease, protease subunit